MSHTPTPWIVEDCVTTLWVGPSKAYAHKVGDIVFSIDNDPDYKPEARAERQANAAFIVRAVNSHEALVEALRVIASRADGYSHGDERVTATFRGIADLAIAALTEHGSK